MAENGIGARFLADTSHYVEDISGLVESYATSVRSQYAHAKLYKVDTSKAASAPAVSGVFIGDDFAAGGIGCHRGLRHYAGLQKYYREEQKSR